MKTIITVLLTVVVLAAAVVAGSALYVRAGGFDISATAEHGPVTDRLFRTVRRSAVAQGERGVDARVPTLDRDALLVAAAGYEDMCAACHAPPGRDETALARGLNPSPPDMVRAAGRYTPEKLFWVTKHGIRMTGMPAWGVTHSDDELWELVAFMRLFPDMSGDEYERLLADARAAGVEHVHGHDDEHDHEHEHDGHDHGHRH